MKRQPSVMIIKTVLDSLQEDELITSNQKEFIKRILDDCLYTPHKILYNTLERAKEFHPEIFEEVIE